MHCCCLDSERESSILTSVTSRRIQLSRRPRIGFYWAASCGGCEIAVLDLNEQIFELISRTDIVFWPVALDTKYKHIHQMPDGFIDFCFFNGGIRNSEQEEMACLLRQKSMTFVAFGSCACYGGVPGLANLFPREQILETVYKRGLTDDNPDGVLPAAKAAVPEGVLTLPKFYARVRPLNQIVVVDYALPGCPPPVPLISEVLSALTTQTLPAKGNVLSPMKALCDDCERNSDSTKKLGALRRIYDIVADPKKCFLEQNLICLGPVTRTGCGHRCIKGNWPCTGCMGPTPGVSDQGARMLSTLAAILGNEIEQPSSVNTLESLVADVKDPVGSIYMYTLAAATIPLKLKPR